MSVTNEGETTRKRVREAVALYEASPIKRRRRSTKAQMKDRRQRLFEIVDAMKPMTVRQVFYQATVRGLVEKTEGGYDKVQTALVLMRRTGWLPYSWITDNTRWQRKPVTYRSINDALRDTAQFYRKALWDSVGCYCEVWLEKDALAGVVIPITARYDVPLMVARGYSSLTFLHSAAEAIVEFGKPTFIYHFGDFDPSGVNASNTVEKTLRELAPDSEIHFESLAVTPEQIDAWKLPTRATKTTDSRAKNFGDISVELDAVPPDALRWLVQEAIERHLPRKQLAVLLEAEKSERELLTTFVDRFGGGAS